MVGLQPECRSQRVCQVLVTGVESGTAGLADVENKTIGQGGDPLLPGLWWNEFNILIETKRITNVALHRFAGNPIR